MRIEKNWESWETEYLVQNAHRMPLEEMCARLERSPNSVKAKAKRLRSYGKSVGELRSCGAVPVQCVTCGEFRYLMAQGGECRVCSKTKRLAGIEERIAQLCHLIPAGSKRNLNEEFAQFKIAPKKAGEDALEWEEKTIREIDKRANARQKTLERIRRDIGL